MTDFTEDVKKEVAGLLASLEGQINDPQQKEAFIRMTKDLALLPIRLSRGDDVQLLLDSIKAEAALYGSAFSLKMQAAVQTAWINIVMRVITKALL